MLEKQAIVSRFPGNACGKTYRSLRLLWRGRSGDAFLV